MIFIDNSRFQRAFKTEWLDLSETNLESLFSCKDIKAIKDHIKTNSIVWNNYLEKLWELGNFKCWYSEKHISLKEAIIEHYRPKGRLVGISREPINKHEGYWWLAFHWENFRVSYSVPNERSENKKTGLQCGKGSYFPIKEPNNRQVYPFSCIFDKVVKLDCSAEEPLLLDPTKSNDVILITFTKEGKVTYAPKISDENKIRVDKSIELLSLDEGTLVDERKEKWEEVRTYVRYLNDALMEYQSNPTNRNLEEVSKYKDSITKAINHRAEYSSCAYQSLKIALKLFNLEDIIEEFRR